MADGYSLELKYPECGAWIGLQQMTVVDRLSRPFLIELVLLSDSFDLDYDILLGGSFTVKMELPGESKFRYFNGILAQMTLAGSSGTSALYRAQLRPWFWLLTRSANSRIFNDKNAVEIVKAILQEAGFSDHEWRLSNSAKYETREYCVQYRETDFDFVNRLFEEEGIYYYFRHADGKNYLVLADAVGSHDKPDGYESIKYDQRTADQATLDREGIGDWCEWREVQPGKFTTTAYNFETPTEKLEVTHTAAANHTYGTLEVYDPPEDYAKTPRGKWFAQVRAEEFKLQTQRYVARGNPRGLGVGNLFKLTDHPRKSQNQEYLVVSAVHDLRSLDLVFGKFDKQPSYTFDLRFETIMSKSQFRPPRVTPKALVQGPQTAVVVGDKNEEIATDKYGRVKVKFHWDRRGDDKAAWDKRSCWIRVSHGWAGKAWGQIFIPRVGQEVIVDFLEGDPDQPIITGRVYNAEQVVPYELPAKKTQSGIKTRSTDKGDTKTFNELRFEDKKGKEEIYFHAERDFNRVVENNDTLKVGFDVKDKGDQTIDIFNNQTITIGTSNAADGSQKLTIYKDRTTQLKTGNDKLTIDKGNRETTVSKGDQKLTISMGNRTSTIKGNDKLTLQTGNQTIAISAGKQDVTAAQSITLKVGPSSIKIDPSGITIKGPMIKIDGSAMVDIKAGGMLTAKSPMTTVKGDGILILKGGVTLIN
ncbi:MAG: type VI secretion system Vgr family protein [Gammaproteobacteria bacterium]